MIDNYCRTEVKAFAVLMENKLQKNDFKGGWQQDSIAILFNKLQGELQELHDAITHKKSRMDVINECVDIANYAMMIADKAGDE